MNILTRYILSSFLKNYLISLFVLIGLYIVLDMVFNFDEFTGSRDASGAIGTVANVAEYYFFQSFKIFAQLAGVIPVAAAAFTFLRLSRFNELTAMMAAGIHLVRVAKPAIIGAAVLSMALPLINQELIIPNILTQLTRDRSDNPEAKSRAYAVQNMQDSNGHLVFASRYTAPTANAPASLDELSVLQVNENFTAAELVVAKKAVYQGGGRWALEDGQKATGLGLGSRGRRIEPTAEYASNITPEEIALYRSGDFVDLLSTPRINELLQRTQIYGANDLLRVKHARLAQLLLNIILVLLTISAVLIRETGQLKWAVMKCLYLVGACMAATFICSSVADHPPAGWSDNWPALMAWTPIFLFGPLSVFLIDRVRT